jgi:hypothetical protein
MHRSGTSLLASVVRQAGVDMGASLMKGERGNPRGHFEDLDFHGFHERFLERREVSPFAVPDGWLPDPAPAELQEARELAARRSNKPAWGFKDPRTSLFLNLWENVLTEPVYLFVYRHPVEVALSLLRRGLELEVQEDPRVALRAWTAYNERLLAFRNEHPDRCLLWHVTGATRSVEASVGRLAERLGVALNRAGVDTLYHPDELLRLHAEEIDWPSLLPEVFDLYRRLEETADLPDADPDGLKRADGRSPEERDLLDASEHLLAALLRTPGTPSSEAVASTLAQRRDYTYLRMLTAQLDETNRGFEERIREIELERTVVESYLSLLNAQQAEENRKLQERIHKIERERSEIESSISMRVVRLYWNAVELARAAKRRLFPGRRVSRDSAPAAPADSSAPQDREATLPG